MKKLNIKTQHGFSILAIILVIVVLIVAISAWSLTGQVNTTSNVNKNNDLQANSIINDAISFKTSFDQLVANGYSPSDIVFIPNTNSTTTMPNILDPTNGVQYIKPNAQVLAKDIVAPEGIWIYNPSGFKGKNIGTSNVDQVMLLAGITDNVCQSINRVLYGNNVVSPQADTMDNNAWISDATLNNPTSLIAIDLNPNIYSNNSPNNWRAGCLLNSSQKDHNLFFYIIKIN